MLLKAVAQGKNKLVKLLIDGGVDVNFPGYDGKTPLIVACSFVAENKDSDSLIVLINLLLKSGANTNAQDMKGRTPLMYAVRHFLSIDIIQLLLDNDADPTILDNNGRSMLHYMKGKCLPKYRCILKQYMASALSSRSHYEQRVNIRSVNLTSIYSQSTVDLENNIFRRVSDSTETCRQNKLTLLPKRKCKSCTSESLIVSNPIPEEIEGVKQTLRTCGEKLSTAEGDNQLIKDDVNRISDLNKKSHALYNNAYSTKTHRFTEIADKRRKTALDTVHCKHSIESVSHTKRQVWNSVSDIDKIMLQTEIIRFPVKLPPIC